jgi:membrane protein insertase Oxa1/YidC/SpoIIIJ
MLGTHTLSKQYHKLRFHRRDWRSQCQGISQSFDPTSSRREGDSQNQPKSVLQEREIASPASIARQHCIRSGYETSSRFQTRSICDISSALISSSIPELLLSFSPWGGTAYLLKTFHAAGVPYWACFSLISLCVRITLIPVVVYSAHVASRFSKVAPEVYSFLSVLRRDDQGLRQVGQTTQHMRELAAMAIQAVLRIYEAHRIRPMALFYSPLLQIPCFMYVSMDLRKLVNGRQPELAQELTTCDGSALYWIQDLTDPDPFYVLPIVAGIAMYSNVEVAMARKSLAGELPGKTNEGNFLKDIFQSLAIFMPCFASHNPAGLQVYLWTSFFYTMVQAVALRNEHIRTLLGLPPMIQGKPQVPEVALRFVELKELEIKADKLRGDGPLLGEHVLYLGWRLSFPGTVRPSTLNVTGKIPDTSHLHIIKFFRYEGAPKRAYDQDVPFIPGISASYDEMAERKKKESQDRMIRQESEMQAYQEASYNQKTIVNKANEENHKKASAAKKIVKKETRRQPKTKSKRKK